MEDHKLLDLSTGTPEHQPNPVLPVTNDEILSEDIKNSFHNDVDDIILVPDKVKEVPEKLPSFENTFEVIDQESKLIHDFEDTAKVTNTSKDEEKENLLESDPVDYFKEDILTPLPESPKKEEPVVCEKLEPVTDTTKTFVQEKDPQNVVQPEVEVADTPEVIPKVIPVVPTKKYSDEGDVCDIKIGPEELFCRIGLGKMVKHNFIYS